MTEVLISFVSAKGSPGVTTSVLAVASRWFRPAVVVDADPFGGDIPAGLGRGSWPPDAGLLELVVDIRSVSVEAALRRRVFTPASVAPPVLSGFGGLGQAGGMPWQRLAASFAQLSDADVLADCGRHSPAGGVAELMAASDHVVLVSGSSLRAARASGRLVPVLRDLRSDLPPDQGLSVLVVRPGRPYAGGEIARSCALPLIGELPHDPGAAQVWSDGTAPGRGFARSALQREAMQVGQALRKIVTGSAATASAARTPGGRP